MKKIKAIIDTAIRRGQKTLSEYDSKKVLAAYGIPVTREVLAKTLADVRAAAKKLKYPVVLKACSDDTIHKTEKGLLAVNLASDKAVVDAFRTLKKRTGQNYGGNFLVQEMVGGNRELMIGMIRDGQFGPSVMFGLGGIFTEILEDVVFRVAPLRKRDTLAMMRGIKGHKILSAFRGMPAVDLNLMSDSMIALGKIALDHPEIEQIDVNPLIIKGSRPVAVDALIVLNT